MVVVVRPPSVQERPRLARRIDASSGLLASSTTLPIAVIARLIGGAVHAIMFSVTAVIVWGLALGAFPGQSQVLAIRARHEVPTGAAPMINTTFNIGIATGSAVGGLILATSNSPVLIIASITIGTAIIGISLMHRWLPPDRQKTAS
jgi:predicted MFS family arabinose efflux permease